MFQPSLTSPGSRGGHAEGGCAGLAASESWSLQVSGAARKAMMIIWLLNLNDHVSFHGSANCKGVGSYCSLPNF